MGVRAGASMALNPALAEEMVAKLQEWAAAGALRPHVADVFPPSRIKEAFALLAERKARGKIVIEWVPGAADATSDLGGGSATTCAEDGCAARRSRL